ncbi:MAG: flagellar hook-basal body complex protein FliE [Deltaproteobacteria bacterium]|nr:flagellar hook-basal body complex protein FliE [Candidatus Tharpella sp.]
MKIATATTNPFAAHLLELQRLSREAQSVAQPATGNPTTTFAGTLNQALQQVNNIQQQADQKITAVTTGQSQDTLGAVVALQRADISMQLLAQVRNKAMKAYEEIIRMPV